MIEEDTVDDRPAINGDGAGRIDKRPPDSDHPRATGGTTATPRWVKVFGIVAVVVVLMVIVMLLAGHGPGQHMHDGLRGHTTSADTGGAVAAFGEHRA